jgi:hypothetical protein
VEDAEVSAEAVVVVEVVSEVVAVVGSVVVEETSTKVHPTLSSVIWP